jgi:hypothetical protein
VSHCATVEAVGYRGLILMPKCTLDETHIYNGEWSG